jgi:hypothetical protein
LKLTQAHWQILTETPIAVFSLVASADGTVEVSEREALLVSWVPRLAKMQLAKDERMHEVYRYILQERCEEALKKGCLMGDHQARDCLKQAGAILSTEMSAEEARFLRHALVILGRDVAKAAASFFGLGARVSSEEKTTIRQIGHLLSA